MTQRAISERYWSHVVIGSPDECWPWAGATNQRGYGNFALGPGLPHITASRFALAEKLGRPVGAHMQACHTCDNPPCCNPAHLFEGTRSDNMRDCTAKGRHWSQVKPEAAVRGEDSGRSVVTAPQVRAIRRLSQDGMSQRALAREFGISKTQAARIIRGESWAWLA